MATAAYGATISITAQPSIAFTNEATSTSDQLTYSITDTAKKFFDRDVAVVTQARYDEIQTVALTGSPTGGTFTLTFGGNTTAGIAYDASASAVQSALEALASIGAGNVLVTGGPGPGTAWVVDFTGTLGYTSQALMTGNGGGLTGGSSPDVSIVETKDGATWATITSGFTLYRVYGRVVFSSAQASTTEVRFGSGSYFSSSTLATAKTADMSAKMATDDVTVFNTNGEETFLVTTRSGSLKLGTVWLNKTLAETLSDRDLLVLDFTVAGDHYAGFYYMTDNSLKSDPKKAITEDITLTLTDEFYTS